MKINSNKRSKTILELDKIPGGLSDDDTVNSLASYHDVPVELIELMIDWGVKVEMEHTSDKKIAREIAMDHIKEDPVYYVKLKEMEDK